MVMLCFVLDLRSLSPPLLRDLKQLANFYSVSAPISDQQPSMPLRDRIGLCYLLKNRFSSADELEVAYNPRGNFSLRDFHLAVNNLPTDAFSPEFNNFGVLHCNDVKLSTVLSDEVLYSWGGNEKDVSRKVILISSCLVENLDSETKRTLIDAADKCISMEFILFDQKSNHLGDTTENITSFVKQISYLENCSFKSCFPDARVLSGLVKRWLQELKDDMDEPLQAHFFFKSNLVGSLSQISCNFYPNINYVVDGFDPCQTCRCHGSPLYDAHGMNIKRSSCCPVTGFNLGEFGLVENSVKVGGQTVLIMSSSRCCLKLQQVSSPIGFNVIERANIGSLSEGVILGTSYFVTPSACHESDDMDKSELNIQLFQGLSDALHSLDQGLVCSSYCNLETLRETSFQCYYILLSSNKGLMLLRRLAGSEEVLPVPDVSQLVESTVAKEIKSSIQTALLEMEVCDYDPVLHERGFHQKLNLLVKESLQFGAIPPESNEANSELNLGEQDSSEEGIPTKQTTEPIIIEEEIPLFDPKVREDKTTESITEEWERLVVIEVPKFNSPTCISKSKFGEPVTVLSLPESNRQLDEKTSRILERLEVPKQLKTKAASPIVSSSGYMETCASTKKPLIPFRPIQAADHGVIASQPMKPSFQRVKRKR